MVNAKILRAEAHTRLLKQWALDEGFFYCGISEASFLENEAARYEKFLAENRHGTMDWMERNIDKRLDPRLLVEGTISVVSLLFNYTPSPGDDILALNEPKISRYAWGRDYHKVIKGKLKNILAKIRTEIGEVAGRAFVDSAPVMEKAWAERAGAGWQGKHTNLISKTEGSWFFIAELLLDLELIPDTPVGDFCGTCTRCIDACPTGAITEAWWLDASKCISYLTIELEEAIPQSFGNEMKGWAFGCDICQEVCPWNRFATPHHTPDFKPNPELFELHRRQFVDLTEEVFERVLGKSPLKRPGFDKFKQNVAFALWGNDNSEQE